MPTTHDDLMMLVTTYMDVQGQETPVPDVDGDTVTIEYEWVVNGTVVCTEPTLLASMTSPGDTVVARARSNDGLLCSPWSAPVTLVLENTAPNQPVIAVTVTSGAPM